MALTTGSPVRVSVVYKLRLHTWSLWIKIHIKWFSFLSLFYSTSAQNKVKAAITSPFLSCQGFGLTRSSASGGTGGSSSSLTVEDEEESDGGIGELAGHSAGRIMQAGIRAPATASLGKTHNISCQCNTNRLRLMVPVSGFIHSEAIQTFISSCSNLQPQQNIVFF